ncbi:MAG TPA: SUMF1/EgtB/PvdO family nonheme iron enzyme [Roseovarius sp.]|nr:SUMF1/EgtB/PvdO family nonheme iron enzyme [Roseovarius sp.]
MDDQRLIKRLPIFTAALAICASLSFMAPAKAETAGIEWRESYYNPKPADDDLILPMPCGGAMAFRKVATPNVDGAIGDVPVTLGQEGDDRPYLNGVWRSYVSGAFSDDGSPTKGYFYMAKYELAEAQYDVVMSGCPDKTPRRRAFLPKLGQTKLEYESFAQAYSLWLMQNAAAALPQAGETRAYLRLPTEEEWEFAARGGMAVESALFRKTRPPIPDGRQLSEYIAHGGSDSAAGRVQVIGSLEGNPLGLHDMLGNAAEIVGTPFSLIRHGRQHGQAGGLVKRGGDARTPLASITSATRDELPPFDVISNEPTQDRFAATRLVVAGLAITSPAQADALNNSLQELAKPDPALSTASSEEEVIALLDAMRDSAGSERDKSRLEAIKSTIQRGQVARNTLRDKSIRLILNSAVLVCDQAVQRYLNAVAAALTIQHDLAELEDEARRAGDEAFLQQVLEAKREAQDKLVGLERKAMANVVEYANLIEGLSEDYSRALLDKQTKFIRTEVEAEGARRAQCLGLMSTHLAARRAAGQSDVDLIALDIQNIAVDQASD